MIFSIAWKNIWRNKLRSLIIILSISLGLLGGIFYLAFANGMAQQQINSSIKTFISNIQIHHPKFLVNNEITYTISDPVSKLNMIRSIKGVKAATSRLVSQAMASSAITGTGISIDGIDPKEEIKVSDINTKVIEGNFFGTKMKNPILIGKKLADKLRIKIHSKLVVTIQDASGDISYGAFRVVGIYKTDNSDFDRFNVYTKKKDLAKLVGMSENAVNEIAILLIHNDQTDAIKDELKAKFANEINAGT
ncbi:MAG: ABC transporter permease, partial [Chlorobi bacterium]|nr:ABC transporter permease [Chlorobiota bacterium]